MSAVSIVKIGHAPAYAVHSDGRMVGVVSRLHEREPRHRTPYVATRLRDSKTETFRGLRSRQRAADWCAS